jgi:tetratricopeptide (TPR) repeat protein
MGITNRRLFLLRAAIAVAGIVLCGAAGWHWYRTRTPENRLRQGQEAVRRGDFVLAERFAIRLEASGALNHAHYLRGEMALVRNDLPAAVAHYNRIRGSVGIRRHASALYGKWFLLKLQRPIEAERFLRAVIAEEPEHVDAHRGLATIYYDQGAWALAVRHLEAWGRHDARDGRPFRLMGLIYHDLDQPQMAVRCYREALGRELKDAVASEVHVELAECLARQSRYAEALEAMPSLDRDSPRLLAIRGECLWGLGRSGEAQPYVDSALQAHPADVDLLLLRARMHVGDGAFVEALPLLEQALRVNPHNHACRYELAQALEGLGRRAEAAEQRRLLDETQAAMQERGRLTMQAGERPWDVEVRLQLASVCDRLEMTEASTLWRRSAGRCPMPPATLVQAGTPP